MNWLILQALLPYNAYIAYYRIVLTRHNRVRIYSPFILYYNVLQYILLLVVFKNLYATGIILLRHFLVQNCHPKVETHRNIRELLSIIHQRTKSRPVRRIRVLSSYIYFYIYGIIFEMSVVVVKNAKFKIISSVLGLALY